MAQDPQTREEWQQAVNAAEFYILVHSAVAYGLVTCSAEIDVARCEEILTRGRAHGVVPDARSPKPVPPPKPAPLAKRRGGKDVA